MPSKTIFILLVLWLIGETANYTFGGLLHVLFFAAFILYGIGLIVEGRKTSAEADSGSFFSQ